MECSATSSCADSLIGDGADRVEFVGVSGYRGAAGAAFDGVAEVRGTGSESVSNATFRCGANSEHSAMTIALSGQSAGRGANAYCQGVV